MTDKQITKQRRNLQRQNFLLTFFSNDPVNQTKNVNGFVLKKAFVNSDTTRPYVSIYTKDSYEKAAWFFQTSIKDKTVPLPGQLTLT